MRDNEAMQGGGIYNSAHMELQRSNLTNNTAKSLNDFAGAALYNSGVGYLMNQTLLEDNHAPNVRIGWPLSLSLPHPTTGRARVSTVRSEAVRGSAEAPLGLECGISLTRGRPQRPL